ncbi:hypothetical protein E4U19_006988 [Claviceps sp. Clav32 group G5]|nr:hypothetical protein E4U19_006988 [Claviceps sp. Clav32 group G5]
MSPEVFHQSRRNLFWCTIRCDLWRYLAGSQDLAIVLDGNTSGERSQRRGADASLTDNFDTRRSIAGHAAMLVGGAGRRLVGELAQALQLMATLKVRNDGLNHFRCWCRDNHVVDIQDEKRAASVDNTQLVLKTLETKLVELDRYVI